MTGWKNNGVPAPQPPKYQVIYNVLRDQILSGALAPGEQLPSQQEMATSHNTSLMTLRQAMASLESDGLIEVAAGRGTFVAERPIDVPLGNLSSFAGEMLAAGVELTSEVLEMRTESASSAAEAALGIASNDEGDALVCLVRRRSVGGVPFSLQRSYFATSVGDQIDPQALLDDSLYQTIEQITGFTVTSARETIQAVRPSKADAALLDTSATQPALLSIRTSLNQFGAPFLFDEALLVGDRCTIAADRTSDRLRISYGFDG